jgi:hypothetical protein
MSGSANETFDATVIVAGDWGSGGADELGVYTGGSVGTVAATLSGTLNAVGDTLTATIGGATLTLRAYSDIPGGLVLTTLNFATFYVFMFSCAYVPSQQYPLSYMVAGNSGLACFLAGTRIATDRGEVAVECLQPGDRVVALRSGRFLPVCWLGRRRIQAPAPALWPVRIEADSFGEGLPRRDLLLSHDHAVFAGGGLIPVRYLVNGASLAIVPPATDRLDYWHVELATHDVLLAEGMPAESYLDTGNRGVFDNAASSVRAHPALARRVWAERACAPLLLDAASHAPVRRRLLARAAELGHRNTDDPALHVRADAATLPLTRDGNVLRAIVPGGTRTLHLCSRSVVPADMLPEGGDSRRLGVGVTQLLLDGAAIAETDPRRVAGWHAPEPGLHWTDGAAVLRLSAPLARAAALEITLAPLLRYWLERAPAAETTTLEQAA